MRAASGAQLAPPSVGDALAREQLPVGQSRGSPSQANGGLEPHPSVAAAFYADLWGNAVRRFGMKMLFTDFLCYRGPAMAKYQARGGRWTEERTLARV